MAEVKLIGFWTSPYVYRVIWALRLKGVNYEYVEDDIYNKSDLILRHNPIHKKVPILIHGENTIVESIVILEYIEETWPDSYPLLPKDPFERAVARFWIKLGDDKSQTFFSFYRTTGEKQEKSANEAKELLKIVQENGLGDNKFFNGNEIGMTDLCFGWIPCFLGSMQEAAGITVLDLDILPRLHAWIKHFKENPVIKETLPDHDEMVKYLKCQRSKRYI